MNELLQSIKADLLSRRLLPFVAVIAVALIGAVAYAATGGGGKAAPPPASAPATPLPGSASALPVAVASANPELAASETPAGASFQTKGATHNPFEPLPSPPAKAAAAGSPKSTGGSGAAGSSNGAAGKAGGAPAAPVAPAPVKAAPAPVHTGLTATQSYAIALALTTSAGGLETIDPLERLSVLPSAQQPLPQQPLLVYLGVLKGGRDALFVVQPGTVVSGPGVCAPGPTDCEILSLKPEQVEGLAVSTGNGTSNVALFAVSAIYVREHASAAAADRARREASAAGRTLLAASTLPALALFEYRPDTGAVVDLRNLAVGGK